MTDSPTGLYVPANGEDRAPFIDLIEYRSAADPDAILQIEGAYWSKIGRRSADRATCLYFHRPGANRRDAIAVRHIVALTVNGVRRPTVTPESHEEIRAQEIAMLCGQDFAEKGASAYYNPASPKFHGYSSVEQSALESLSTGSSALFLPIVNDKMSTFEVQYREWDGTVWEVSGTPVRVLGTYSFSEKGLNISRITIMTGEDFAEHDISANNIIHAIDLQTGVIQKNLEWLTSLQINTSEIDELTEVRARFATRFGKAQARLVSPPPASVRLLSTSKVAERESPQSSFVVTIAQVGIIAVFVFAVVASLISQHG